MTLLDVTFGDGCQHSEILGSTTTSAGDKRLSHTFKTPKKIASVGVQVRFTDNLMSEDPSQVFSDEMIIDDTLHPPAYPHNPCGNPPSSLGGARPTREQLRKRAEADPDGADAQAIGNMGQNEVLATAINTGGFLCARVTSAYPGGDDIVVNCVKYRNGRGKAKYRIDTADMEVIKLD